MNIEFIKMHGLGNDFVLVNALARPFSPDAGQIRYIADRRRGVGCDQVLIIEKSRNEEADFFLRIFNADGSTAEQCGNGLRCVGDYLRRNALFRGDSVTVDTAGGPVTLYPENGDRIRVNMGVPVFEPADIPLSAAERQVFYSLSLAFAELELMAVSMGNPHAVVIVDDVDLAPVSTLGPEIQSHAMFPESVNVGFMQVLDPGHIRLRVFERGVGETLACGTGACGAVASGIIAGRLDNDVDIELRGGHLAVSWAGEGQALWLAGPATTVYAGQIEI